MIRSALILSILILSVLVLSVLVLPVLVLSVLVLSVLVLSVLDISIVRSSFQKASATWCELRIIAGVVVGDLDATSEWHHDHRNGGDDIAESEDQVSSEVDAVTGRVVGFVAVRLVHWIFVDSPRRAVRGGG